jgi:hypothetical protein
MPEAVIHRVKLKGPSTDTRNHRTTQESHKTGRKVVLFTRFFDLDRCPGPCLSFVRCAAPKNGSQAKDREVLGFLHNTLYAGFVFEDIEIHLEAPDQVFAEYFIRHKSGISGKKVNQQFFGHLQAENGKIKRLREAVDVVQVAEAIYPKGLIDALAKKS